MRQLKKAIWPYTIQIWVNNSDIEDAITEWCNTYVGKKCHDWYGFTDRYAFKQEEDLLLFKLRWKES